MLKNDFQSKNVKGKSIKQSEIFGKNKVISIFINIIGYKNIIDQLKKVNLKHYTVILRPHPHLKNIREKIINEFKHNLNTKIFIYDKLTNRQVIKCSKFIICDDGSTAIESLLYKKQKN